MNFFGLSHLNTTHPFLTTHYECCFVVFSFSFFPFSLKKRGGGERGEGEVVYLAHPWFFEMISGIYMFLSFLSFPFLSFPSPFLPLPLSFSFPFPFPFLSLYFFLFLCFFFLLSSFLHFLLSTFQFFLFICFFSLSLSSFFFPLFFPSPSSCFPLLFLLEELLFSSLKEGEKRG